MHVCTGEVNNSSSILQRPHHVRKVAAQYMYVWRNIEPPVATTLALVVDKGIKKRPRMSLILFNVIRGILFVADYL